MHHCAVPTDGMPPQHGIFASHGTSVLLHQYSGHLRCIGYVGSLSFWAQPLCVPSWVQCAFASRSASVSRLHRTARHWTRACSWPSLLCCIFAACSLWACAPSRYYHWGVGWWPFPGFCWQPQLSSTFARIILTARTSAPPCTPPRGLYSHCSFGPLCCALGLAWVFLGTTFAQYPALHLWIAQHCCPGPPPSTVPAHCWVVCTLLDLRTLSPCVELTVPRGVVTALHVCATFCPTFASTPPLPRGSVLSLNSGLGFHTQQFLSHLSLLCISVLFCLPTLGTSFL